MSNVFSQRHFTLYELILPYCTVCTPIDGLSEPWYTPVTCEESSDSTYKLWFTQDDAPMFLQPPEDSITGVSWLNGTIFRCVTGATETTAKLKGGEGLASRGEMSVTMSDFSGDPGPIEASESGSFFGKLLARNILEGKKIVSHHYAYANETLTEYATTTHFVTTANLTNNKLSIKAKDALKDIEAFSEKFPEPSEVTLTSDINATTTHIPVSDGTQFTSGSVFRIDNELFYVDSVSSNDLTVAGRGSSLTNPNGQPVYETNTDEHNNGSTVQLCYVMSNTALQDVLQDIFTAVGMDIYADYAQWTTELDEWNAGASLYGVISSPQKVSDLISEKLTDYLMDAWFDQATQKVLLSAVTAWKESSRTLVEGADISDLKISKQDNTRFSRAIQYNGKRYQAESDDVSNYSKLAIATDTLTEVSDYYGSIKVKDFGFSNTSTKSSAQILCTRYVQRYARTPEVLTFKMEERKLDGLSLGSVVEVKSRGSQAPDGTIGSSTDRAQIINIKPNLSMIGRQYNITALSYVPLISTSGGEVYVTLTGTHYDLNLFSRAGAPNIAVNITFIFDACTIGSNSQTTPSVYAGAFPAGSRVRIICINDTRWSAKGGDGGGVTNEWYESNNTGAVRTTINKYPDAGANAYQSNGVTTEIYLNYTDIDGYTPNSRLYAAGGGCGAAGAIAALFYFDVEPIGIAASSVAGGGGSGIPGGSPGTAYSYAARVGVLPASVPTTQTGQAGTFTTGGSGVVVSPGRHIFPNGTAYVEAYVTSTGFGGSSAAGASATNASAAVGGGVTGPTANSPNVSGGAVGGAIKGANVTVYNLAASSGDFKPGDSDAYTLVDS